MQTLSQNAMTRAQCLKEWNLLQPSKNPPNGERIPATLDYLRILETDSAYIVPQGKTENVRTYRRRIYDARFILTNTETNPPHAHRPAVADYWIVKNMEESVYSPSHRLNEDNMVQDYTRYLRYKRTLPQNPYSSYWELSPLQ